MYTLGMKVVRGEREDGGIKPDTKGTVVKIEGDHIWVKWKGHRKESRYRVRNKLVFGMPQDHDGWL